jgi:geranylgeranyl transferase type-2 subunit beta
MDNYLLRLSSSIADGLSRLPEEVSKRHAAYLQACQNSDGGFSGREGGSDHYYTGFALRGLAVTDALEGDVCRRAAGFLRQSLTQQASVVDFFSLLYSCFLVQAAGEEVLGQSPPDWPERVAATLETFRTADHGYARAAGHAGGSVYHTFLVGLCYQLLGRNYPNPEQVAGFIQSRRREDGGYVEIGAMRRSGTNPTAAAVGTLQLLSDHELGIRGQGSGVRGQSVAYASGSEASNPSPLIPVEKEAVIQFLLAVQSPEGGFRGNARAPVADLLSTFTSVWTLSQLGALHRVNTDAIAAYTRAVELPQGGFRGGLWDEHTDVEYTFYGLGCLALLSGV